MSPLSLRPATADDLPAINAIYNHYVACSTCTYQTDPESDADRRKWFQHHGSKHPVIVAERDGQIVGWGSLSTFRDRAAYDNTVENSVYVRHDAQRQGIGATILEDLFVKAKQLGHHVVIAAIDGEQGPSIALHAKFGFVEVGHLREVGSKFGRWLDVVYMQKTM